MTQSNLIKFAFFLIAPFALSSFHAQAASETSRKYEIFCAPGLPSDRLEKLEEILIEFIKGALEGLSPGDSISLHNGYSGEMIGTFRLEGDFSPRLRKRKSRGLAENFIEHMKKISPPGNRAALNLPLIIGGKQPDAANTRILAIGSPRYYDDVDAHDMRKGWLSDGYFNAPPEKTFFSIIGKEGLLNGASVVICTLESDTSIQLRNLERFWAIYIQECGGRLSGWESGLESAFRVFTSQNPTERRITPPRNKDDKAPMILSGTIEIVDQPQPQVISFGGEARLSVKVSGKGPFSYQWQRNGVDIPGANSDIFHIRNASGDSEGIYTVIISSEEGRIVTAPAKIEIQKSTAGTSPPADVNPPEKFSPNAPPRWLTMPVEEYTAQYPPPDRMPDKNPLMVGLRWETQGTKNLDLDLHVRPGVGRQELSFRNPSSPEGHHFKDFSSNPDAKHGYEIVELLTPVDPRELSVWVNAFNGTSTQGFKGEVRLFYAGLLRKYPFHIPATVGNYGKNSNKRNQDPCWVEITTNL